MDKQNCPPAPQNNIAIALTDLGTRVKLGGHLPEGMSLYERALAYNPRYADALYNLGVAHGAWRGVAVRAGRRPGGARGEAHGAL